MQSFSRQHIQQHFNHAAPSYDDAAILQKTVAERIDERLALTTIGPNTILDVGAGTGLLTQQVIKRYPHAQLFAVDLSPSMLKMAQPRLQAPRWPNLPKPFNQFLSNCKLTKAIATRQAATAVNADVNQLPFADDSVDLIVSNLMLQWCDDLDQVFAEFRRVLRPEGLLMFTTFGPDTLKELKQAWQTADATYEHVNNFIDMHDIGDALIRNGFGQPVMDMEIFTLTYDQPMGILKDLKAIGATNANKQRNNGLMGKQRFSAMLNAYEALRSHKDNKIPATYEVVHGHAWAAQEVVKGPNRDKSGYVEISLDEFSKQLKK
ncbi:malonyl-[acyl-carrier protein] O-methyltransferase [Thiomicrorhabdus immobilis]|uniref:Malonyl-[acyl-carrier protein] O-methyltransferase n=1 Tax=Thiomicrorhabdus immobilis TaxID=2791037 RepID=A0ABM7MAL6_9GAMM|nr:malonyl-ACP O-methyltransferase BioC [Thiomicrorhabdus immobilis]BCN92392.1 malonyl-[acyl-carrier protein] O-methyltransferase [Thiomicrorhabdus immobilis]